ncbi:MAG: hypothetical protein KBD19_00250 [Candidatus Moranbacteria bacterium]|nr:hypothetical protein [Candidatus Moranbacteria bacterium]
MHTIMEQNKGKKGQEAVSRGEEVFSFARSLRDFSEVLLPRTREIVSSRFGLSGGKTKTLEEIGKEYGITRERVRQILASAFSLVKQRRDNPSYIGAASRIEESLADHSGILAADDLFAVLSGGDKSEYGAIRFFLECLKSVKEEKETRNRPRTFVVAGFPFSEWEKVFSTAESVLRDAGTTLDADEFYDQAVKRRLSVDRKTFFDYLMASSAIRKNAFGRFGFSDSSEVRPRGTREKAYLVLKMNSAPLHFKDIAARIDEIGLQRKGRKTHPQTVHNELIKDKKFVLVGRGLYALSEWGYRRGTVREVLDGILSTSGAPMKRDRILEEVLRVRQVKRSTIIINLNAFFEKVGKEEYTVKTRR